MDPYECRLHLNNTLLCRNTIDPISTPNVTSLEVCNYQNTTLNLSEILTRFPYLRNLRIIGGVTNNAYLSRIIPNNNLEVSIVFMYAQNITKNKPAFIHGALRCAGSCHCSMQIKTSVFYHTFRPSDIAPFIVS